jgi:hypothetical protein
LTEMHRLSCAIRLCARSHVPQKRLRILILTMATALVACSASSRENLRVDWILPGEHQIAVSLKNFSATTPMRVRYTDSWQTEEYALFQAEGMQLEIIYAEASKAFRVTLDYQMPIKEMVATWNLNSRQKIIWGPLARIDTRLGTWFYRTYELSNIHRSCAGFMVEWGEIYEDPKGRPGKVLFGYLCAAEGMALENDQIRTLVSGIGIRPQAEPPDVQKALSDISAGFHRPAATETARGKNRLTHTGNPRFPFKFARYYSESGGREFK